MADCVQRGSVTDLRLAIEHTLDDRTASPTVYLIDGDSLALLKELPDDFIRTTVTSPPYWSLRDYGIEGQIGLEESLEAYLDSLLGNFSRVAR